MEALKSTGANPDAATRLTHLLRAHDILTNGLETQNDLSIFLKGGATEQMKTDIISSLVAIEQRPVVPVDTRVAAESLIQLLQCNLDS